MFAPSCPSLPPPPPRASPERAAVTVLRADRVTAGPLAEHCQGPLHRRHLPARPRRHTHREGTGGRGAAGRPGRREARWERAPLPEGAVGRGTPRGRRGLAPSLPNPGARHRPASSRDWRARLNKAAARRGGAGALPRASRRCRGPGRAGARCSAGGGDGNGRGNGPRCPALGNNLLRKVGTSACVSVTAVLKHATHCSGLYPESWGKAANSETDLRF